MTNQPYLTLSSSAPGTGGSTMAYALKDTGSFYFKSLERGDFLPPEAQNWDARAGFALPGPMKPGSTSASRFKPRIYYNVGRQTKVYGAAMCVRAEDFTGLAHEKVTPPPGPSPTPT